VCATLVLASPPRGVRGLQRFRTRQAVAGAAVAVLIAAMAGAYTVWDAHSEAGQRLHHVQSVDTIFVNIVTGHDHHKAADLRALHLPVSWARYAGKYYWAPGSVRTSPLYDRYEPELTDTNVAHFLLTHPGRIYGIGNHAALKANQSRVTTLGDYPPGYGYPPGAYESRVIVITWLDQHLSGHLGLAWLLALWVGLLAIGLAALRWRRGRPWWRDGAVVVLSLTACAVLAFIPPGFFESISTTRHMVVTNLATDLAVAIAIALAGSMIGQAVVRHRAPDGPADRSRPARPDAGAVPEPRPPEVRAGPAVASGPGGGRTPG
jgi:hypothetical protein